VLPILEPGMLRPSDIGQIFESDRKFYKQKTSYKAWPVSQFARQRIAIMLIGLRPSLSFGSMHPQRCLLGCWSGKKFILKKSSLLEN